MAETKSPSPGPDIIRNRLPTMFEVLSRRTLPPVDLYSFYIYMRDQQRSVDYLDFWYVLKSLRYLFLCEPHTNCFLGLTSPSTCPSAGTMFESFADRS